MKEYISLLGKTAKDKISGLTGVITSVSYDLYGCIQVVLTPPAKKGDYVMGTWFDVNRVKIFPKNRVMSVPNFPKMDSVIKSEELKGAAEKPTQMR